MNNVVSFSGGRTSAYLVHLMEQKRKAGEIDNVYYVFMDTGAEHPKTYEFIQKCVDHFGIELTCIRNLVTHEKGIGVSYREVPLSECKHDLQPWKEFVKKYGTPYVVGAHCTARMKTDPYDKWCADKFGKGNFVSWLGIRVDEGNRLKQRDNIRYLAEISSMEKHDILGWWREQPFDLEIEEWLGNCVFCMKKGVNKIALAERDEPELAKEFDAMLASDEVRTLPSKKSTNNAIYRNYMTIPQIVATFEPFTSEQILGKMRGSSGACAESCEVFGCQGDLFAEQE